MVARQRPSDRGVAKGRHALRALGPELRLARALNGLSVAAVAREAGISPAEVSRIERAEAEWVSVVTMAKICAIVGLDLSVRAYPGQRPLRDVRHAALLDNLRKLLHPSLSWSLEVPLPNSGDQRAWDAMIRGSTWKFGVECELNPIDGQALLRRLHMKQRDGKVDGVILLMPDTRQTRLFRREYREQLAIEFPSAASTALAAVGAGAEPVGSAVLVL